MKKTLVIMAAGMGSRYGGDKQVDGIGPHHEILMEYSIYDALRAGFGKVVFIIKPGMEEMLRTLCGDYLEKKRMPDGTPVEVKYVFQDDSSVPSFYRIPAGRTKPFGTVHALLCAADAVREPFCVINADDYYGADAYRTIYDALGHLPEHGAAMVGYLLKNTVSANGAVSRGLCAVRDGWLCSVTETKEIRLEPDGVIRDAAHGRVLDPQTPVSMNYWGFMPEIFPVLRTYFHEFLHQLPEGELRAECLLPVMIGDLLQKGEIQVSVLHSADRWFGMTYRADRETVAEELRRLHEAGVYPDDLTC